MRISTFFSLGLSALLAVTAMTSCSSDTPDPQNQDPENDKNYEYGQTTEVSDARRQEAIDGFSQFAVNLLNTVDSASKDENVCVSPVSLNFAFTMLANGAAGDTQAEILKTLSGGDMTMAELNTICRHILDTWTADKEATVKIANSLWYASNFPVRPAFGQKMEEVFDAEIIGVSNLSSLATMRQINQWIGTATNGLIPSLLDKPLSPTAATALINALYFKSEWQEQFCDERTYDADFTNSNGSISKVKMMHTDLYSAPVSEANGYRSIDLLLGGGYKLRVIISANDKSVPRITPQLLKELDKNISYHYTFFSLPRFEMELKNEIGELIKALGIRKAFDESLADFSPLSPQSSYVNRVIHGTKFIVNEYGIEAAGTTIIENATTGIHPDAVWFPVNQPFAFMLLSSDNNILFNGYVKHL